jgi:hypothetical protein
MRPFFRKFLETFKYLPLGVHPTKSFSPTPSARNKSQKRVYMASCPVRVATHVTCTKELLESDFKNLVAAIKPKFESKVCEDLRLALSQSSAVCPKVVLSFVGAYPGAKGATVGSRTHRNIRVLAEVGWRLVGGRKISGHMSPNDLGPTEFIFSFWKVKFGVGGGVGWSTVRRESE